jgi:hypothetical protein
MLPLLLLKVIYMPMRIPENITHLLAALVEGNSNLLMSTPENIIHVLTSLVEGYSNI